MPMDIVTERSLVEGLKRSCGNLGLNLSFIGVRRYCQGRGASVGEDWVILIAQFLGARSEIRRCEENPTGHSHTQYLNFRAIMRTAGFRCRQKKTMIEP
jgi:hypothetical protein